MTVLEHSIEINQAVARAFALARQVERYPEFMKDYLESRIIERGPDGDVVERAALVKGRRYVWKSRVRFQENRGVHFEHLEGPLHGMQVHWDFLPLAPNRTRLSITHRFRIAHALAPVGWALERWYYKPHINDIANRVVVSFKQACEAMPAFAVPTETAARS
ncbi:MAG TPA: SRPBCC family protein [Elusimicrobiota bacterium]|nr:SRPBCC family protein [Elusimicrobiota bacterium]